MLLTVKYLQNLQSSWHLSSKLKPIIEYLEGLRNEKLNQNFTSYFFLTPYLTLSEVLILKICNLILK